jgi:myosin heavy subunit
LAITELLGLPHGVLNTALTHQTITARGQSYQAHLSFEKATYARDALAKVGLSVIYIYIYIIV